MGPRWPPPEGHTIPGERWPERQHARRRVHRPWRRRGGCARRAGRQPPQPPPPPPPPARRTPPDARRRVRRPPPERRTRAALVANSMALNGTMPCQPRPTLVRGMRRQPVNSTGKKVIHSASQMWQYVKTIDTAGIDTALSRSSRASAPLRERKSTASCSAKTVHASESAIARPSTATTSHVGGRVSSGGKLEASEAGAARGVSGGGAVTGSGLTTGSSGSAATRLRRLPPAAGVLIRQRSRGSSVFRLPARARRLHFVFRFPH
eukprot:scaffold12017_cov120-Isochrysis_galbana.AAC.6